MYTCIHTYRYTHIMTRGALTGPTSAARAWRASALPSTRRQPLIILLLLLLLLLLIIILLTIMIMIMIMIILMNIIILIITIATS